MSGVFRFSNAVSDIDKIIDTYKKLYSHFIEDCNNGQYFGHSEAAEFLAINGLASSLGAIGATALKRSTRADKSRDPLYNQHKSYSEMFRMLGWYEPGTMQTNFKLSEYGAYIAEEKDKTILKRLVSMNVLHIVSPNPLTNVKGGNTLRPFPMILKLMLKLDGVITRDEIIVGVLCCQNDKQSNTLNETVKMILQLREGGSQSMDNAISEIRNQHNLESTATLQNYTRFPIAIMKWTGWANSRGTSGLYGNKKMVALHLTNEGCNIAKEIIAIPDIRFEEIQNYPPEVQGAFTALSNLTKLQKAGFDLGEYAEMIPKLTELCQPIIDKYCVVDNNFLFFGYQEAPRPLLKIADNILEKL